MAGVPFSLEINPKRAPSKKDAPQARRSEALHGRLLELEDWAAGIARPFRARADGHPTLGTAWELQRRLFHSAGDPEEIFLSVG